MEAAGGVQLCIFRFSEKQSEGRHVVNSKRDTKEQASKKGRM
jgi:hypothetical protein